MRKRNPTTPLSIGAFLALALLCLASGPLQAQAAAADSVPRPSASAAKSVERRAIGVGGVWGMMQGAGLVVALGSERSDGGVVQEPRIGSVFLGMIGGGFLGLVGGSVAATRGLGEETVNTAGWGSIWGMWVGMAAAEFMGFDDVEQAWALMAVQTAGLLGGGYVGSRWAPGEARLRRMNEAAMTAAYVGVGMALVADSEDDRWMWGAGLAGGFAGLLWGTFVSGGSDSEDAAAAPAAEGARRPGGALFNRSLGEWSLSAPLPSPMPGPGLGARARAGAGGDGLAWRVPLLTVKFD